MVGHQQPGADLEARRVTQQIGARILELNATNRARRERTLGKVVDAVEIVALDDPLEPDLSRQDVGGLLKELALAELLFLHGHRDRTVAEFPVQFRWRKISLFEASFGSGDYVGLDQHHCLRK